VLVSTNIRNWGPGSDLKTLIECAEVAEEGGISTVWVNDLLSTPEAKGWSADDGGRFMDPLMTLSFLAGRTNQINLGTGILIVPYRPAFQQYKEIATLQELSGGRFRFGVGVGWNENEFQALGIPYAERGKRTDETLALMTEAFASDAITINGAMLPALPRPPRPPFYIGGMTDVALRRVIKFGDGWLASGLMPDEIAKPMARLSELAQEAGKPTPTTIVMKTLPLDDVNEAIEMAQAYAEAGCYEISHGDGYADATAYKRRIEILAEKVIPSVAT